MQIRQYVYFSIGSETMTADEMTNRLGLQPDRATVRGSKRTEPTVIPIQHGWSIYAAEQNAAVGDQIAQVIARLRPHQDSIRALVADLGSSGGAELQIVRRFNDPEGEEEHPETFGELQKLPGQHQLLGWHLDRDTVGFLLAVGASLDVDEYDMAPGQASWPAG